MLVTNQTIGTYYDQERAYKQDLLDNYASILDAGLQNPELGEETYQASGLRSGVRVLQDKAAPIQ